LNHIAQSVKVSEVGAKGKKQKKKKQNEKKKNQIKRRKKTTNNPKTICISVFHL
jgi:hypothetical protein